MKERFLKIVLFNAFHSLFPGTIQPRPQGLLLVQNGGRGNTWPRLLKYSTNRGVFCHVTRDKTAFRSWFATSGDPVCFLQSETVIRTKRRHFIVFAFRNSNELLESLWQPWPEVSPTAIWTRRRPWGRGWKPSEIKEIFSAGSFWKFESFNRMYFFYLSKASVCCCCCCCCLLCFFFWKEWETFQWKARALLLPVHSTVTCIFFSGRKLIRRKLI